MLKKQSGEFKSHLEARGGQVWLDEAFVAAAADKQTLYERWYKQTGEAGEIYPSQGLLTTPYDYLQFLGKTLVNEAELADVLKGRYYLLALFNDPVRLGEWEAVERAAFISPEKVMSTVMDYAMESGLALSVGDLGAIVTGTNQPRLGRRDMLAQGPFIKLGKHARIPFSSGAMPDVFGAPAALATMAMCHGIACVPRNGVFSDPKRQTDLVKATFSWMREEELLNHRKDARRLLARWHHNLVGVIEPELDKGLPRALMLYEAGIRAFRVHSPEPGTDAQKMVAKIKQELNDRVEVFAGQVASVEQAKRLEAAGADGVYAGIGGGGRCITAKRSGSVVDWPNLVWSMRGEIGIPIIVEGGASDNVGVSLLLGVSGIGVTRKAAGGTIESPGGLLYLVNKEGEWFKPYGGEASARTKYQDGKMLAMGIPAFVEGETAKAIKSYVPHIKPTVAANIYFLLEDLVLSLVFRGVKSVSELQALDPSPLRRISVDGKLRQGVH